MAGSISYAYDDPKPQHGKNHKVTATWTSDSSGDVNGVEKVDIRGTIQAIVTDPSATAPSANYDVVINDDEGIDVAGGLLANRHTSTTERVVPFETIGTLTDVNRYVHGPLDIVVSNAGAAKIGDVVIYWVSD